MDNFNLGILGGCGSSGTTLLIHLLSRHPDIASGPEFNLFNHYELYNFDLLKKHYQRMLNGKCYPSGYIDTGAFMTYREHYGINNKLISSWIESSSTLSDFISAITRHMHNHFSAPYFLEKSPTNVYGFRYIAEQFPEIPIVHVIRDGRDVACSLRKREFNLFSAGSRWLYDTLCGLSVRNAPNYLEIRYEQLVQHPDETLKSIFTHFGVRPDFQLSNESDTNNSSIYNEDWSARETPKVWNQRPSDPISTASIGKYKKVLSEKEQDLLKRITIRDCFRHELMPNIKTFGDLLEYTGYGNSIDSISSGFDEVPNKWNLQYSDYIRRLNRLTNRHMLKLPRIYTYID